MNPKEMLRKFTVRDELIIKTKDAENFLKRELFPLYIPQLNVSNPEANQDGPLVFTLRLKIYSNDEKKEINSTSFNDFIFYLKEIFNNRDFILIKEHFSGLEKFGFNKNKETLETNAVIDYLAFYTNFYEFDKFLSKENLYRYTHIEFSDETWNKTLLMKKNLDELYMDIVRHPLLDFFHTELTSRHFNGYMDAIKMSFFFSMFPVYLMILPAKQNFFVNDIQIEVDENELFTLPFQNDYKIMKEMIDSTLYQIFEEYELRILMEKGSKQYFKYYRYLAAVTLLKKLRYEITNNDTIEWIDLFNKSLLMEAGNVKYLDETFSSQKEMDDFFHHFYNYLLVKQGIKKPTDFGMKNPLCFHDVKISLYDLEIKEKCKLVILGFSLNGKELYMASLNDLNKMIGVDDYEIDNQAGSLESVEIMLKSHGIVLTPEQKIDVMSKVNELMD